MQFDEKWDFVGQKQKNDDPGEQATGDCWDHLALDLQSRLSDEYPAYADANRTAYGEVVHPPRTGRPRKATVVVPAGLTYATVHKQRANGRVVRVSTTRPFGTWFMLAFNCGIPWNALPSW